MKTLSLAQKAIKKVEKKEEIRKKLIIQEKKAKEQEELNRIERQKEEQEKQDAGKIKCKHCGEKLETVIIRGTYTEHADIDENGDLDNYSDMENEFDYYECPHCSEDITNQVIT